MGVKSVRKRAGRPPSEAQKGPEIEARDYVYDAAKMRKIALDHMAGFRNLMNSAKKLAGELEKNVETGVVERPTAKMLFPDMEEAGQHTQAATLKRLELGLAMAMRMLDAVPEDGLEAMRKAFSAAMAEQGQPGEEAAEPHRAAAG